MNLKTRNENAELRRAAIADRDRTMRANGLASDDPLAELRREALLVLGYAPDHRGEISAHVSQDRDHSAVLEQTLGRCLIRYLNVKARAN